MNIGPLCSSQTSVLVGVLNVPYNFGLLVALATDGPQELVTRCAQNLNQTSILLWRRFCTPTCYMA